MTREEMAAAVALAVAEATDALIASRDAAVAAARTLNYYEGYRDGANAGVIVGQRDERAAATKRAKEMHGLILMLLDQMYGRAVIDLAEQEAHDPNRLLKWWRDERKFLHIVIDAAPQEGH